MTSHRLTAEKGPTIPIRPKMDGAAGRFSIQRGRQRRRFKLSKQPALHGNESMTAGRPASKLAWLDKMNERAREMEYGWGASPRIKTRVQQQQQREQASVPVNEWPRPGESVASSAKVPRHANCAILNGQPHPGHLHRPRSDGSDVGAPVSPTGKKAGRQRELVASPRSPSGAWTKTTSVRCIHCKAAANLRGRMSGAENEGR